MWLHNLGGIGMHCSWLIFTPLNVWILCIFIFLNMPPNLSLENNIESPLHPPFPTPICKLTCKLNSSLPSKLDHDLPVENRFLLHPYPGWIWRDMQKEEYPFSFESKCAYIEATHLLCLCIKLIVWRQIMYRCQSPFGWAV